MAEVFTPTPIKLTDRAVSKAKELIDGEGNPSLHLRVFVTGGGCSGFQYGFSFDDESQEDDTEIVKDGVKVVVDAMSYQYLVGSTVDYSESLTGSQFVVENPNASNASEDTTSGCTVLSIWSIRWVLWIPPPHTTKMSMSLDSALSTRTAVRRFSVACTSVGSINGN